MEMLLSLLLLFLLLQLFLLLFFKNLCSHLLLRGCAELEQHEGEGAAQNRGKESDEHGWIDCVWAIFIFNFFFIKKTRRWPFFYFLLFHRISSYFFVLNPP